MSIPRNKWNRWSVFTIRPLVLLVLFLLHPHQTFSSPPIPFDGWTNRGGNITATCPTGFSCSNNVSESGVMQRMVTEKSTGKTYVQLIVTDGVVTQTGNSTLENFVSASNLNQSGTALKHVVTQRGDYNMDYTILLNTGWADDNKGNTINISQQIADTTAEGVGFDYTFDYRANLGPNDTVTGAYFGIRQTITNSGRLNGSNTGGTDIHTFVLRRAKGNMLNSGGGVTLSAPAGMGMGGGGGGGGSVIGGGGTVVTGGTSTGEGEAPCGSEPLTNLTPGQPPPCSLTIAPANPGSQGSGSGSGAAAPPGTLTPPPRGSGTIPVPPQPPGAGGGIGMGMGQGGVPAGGTVTWSTGNEVQVIWIGQNCPGCVQAGGMGGMGGGNGQFSYQAYENLSTGASAATRDIFSSAPFVWNDPPFGPRPGL